MIPRRWVWLLGILGSLGLVVSAFLAAFVCLVARPNIPEPDPATAERLEAAADQWWKPSAVWGYVPRAKWPADLLRLAPQDVIVRPEGVYLRFGSSFVEEWGLFILPKSSDFEPRRGTDPSYRVLRGRIYSYEIKG